MVCLRFGDRRSNHWAILITKKRISSHICSLRSNGNALATRVLDKSDTVDSLLLCYFHSIYGLYRYDCRNASRRAIEKVGQRAKFFLSHSRKLPRVARRRIDTFGTIIEQEPWQKPCSERMPLLEETNINRKARTLRNIFRRFSSERIYCAEIFMTRLILLAEFRSRIGCV